MAGCEGGLLGANTKDCALLLPGPSQDIKNFFLVEKRKVLAAVFSSSKKILFMDFLIRVITVVLKREALLKLCI
jgi:hypothetical protein